MKYFQQQVLRIDRLLQIVFAQDQFAMLGGLRYEDVLTFTCQSMWHLKDWILNDPEFRALSMDQLSADIHNEHCLMICADIANGTKHMVLSNPKTGVSLSDQLGIHVEPSRGIHQDFYYIHSRDDTDAYHGMEIKDFLRECRDAWTRIINEHHLSALDS